MRKTLSCLLMVAILATSITVVFAETTTRNITAERIAVISDYQPTTNKLEYANNSTNKDAVNLGSYSCDKTQCTAKHAHDLTALMHFTIPNYVAEDVEKVTLRIYYQKRNKSGQQELVVSQISNTDWNSDSTYQNATPVRTGKEGRFTTGGAGDWKGIDITDLVTAEGTVNVAFTAYLSGTSTDASLDFCLTKYNEAAWGEIDYTPYIVVKTKAPSTKDAVFTATTRKYSKSTLDRSVSDSGDFGDATLNSYGGSNGTYIPLRRTNDSGTDCNIGISRFDFSDVKPFAERIVAKINMYSNDKSNSPSVYLIPENATKLSECTFIGELTIPEYSAWTTAEIDVTEAVKNDDDGVIDLGVYVPADKYTSGRSIQMYQDRLSRYYDSYGIVTKDNLSSVPAKAKMEATRKVVVGTADATKSIVPIIAVYNSDELKDVVIGDKIEGLNGSYANVNIAIPEYTYEENDYIKVFYWNNMMEISPVLDSQEIKVN